MADNEVRCIQPDDVGIYVERMDIFNCVMYQYGISPIRGIRIVNNTQDPIEDLSLVIMPETEMMCDTCIPLDPVLPGKPMQVDDPEIHINGELLAELTEPISINVKMALLQGDEFITGIQGEIMILTYDQSMGSNYRDLLSSFVMPNHPVVVGLIHDAAMILKKWGKDPSLEGYQREDPNRVIELAAAAYAAIQKKNIVYAEPPATAELYGVGQRIRTPEVMLEQRLGTCMDMTLLYAACLEAMGLRPVLYAKIGHIFTGFWLHETQLSEIFLINGRDTNEEIVKRYQKGSGEILFVECTAMCAGNSISYEQAMSIPEKKGNLSPEKFNFALDVCASREKGIRPLFSRTLKDGHYEIDVVERKDDEITAAPEARKIVIQKDLNTGKRKITNKKEI